MDLNRNNLKRIRGLILFTAVVCLAAIKIDRVLNGFFFVIGILKPFIYGAVAAFVLNIPMSAIEKRLFGNGRNSKIQKAKRPASIFLAFISVILIMVVVTVTVVPQLTKTMMELGNKIPLFLSSLEVTLEQLLEERPELVVMLEELDFDSINWNSVLNGIVDFMKNGLGNVVTSTVMVASTIIGGVVNLFVALVFSFYILAQKEKLGDQLKRVMHAYFSQGLYERALEVASLANRNFSNFITGQCMEAVILGSMFVVSMAVFRFPYALLVGVLIAFTALIPIVGAFIDFPYYGGRSDKGGLVFSSFYYPAASGGKSDLPSCGGEFGRTSFHMGIGGSHDRRQSDGSCRHAYFYPYRIYYLRFAAR